MRDGEIIGKATDPQGKSVVLIDRIWHTKVLFHHAEMEPFLSVVLETVASPDHVENDPGYADRKRYYTRKRGPSQWLLVVVSYEQTPARIISAFGNRKGPGSWTA